MFLPCFYHVFIMFFTMFFYHVFTMFLPYVHHVFTMFLPCVYHVFYHVFTIFLFPYRNLSSLSLRLEIRGNGSTEHGEVIDGRGLAILWPSQWRVFIGFQGYIRHETSWGYNGSIGIYWCNGDAYLKIEFFSFRGGYNWIMMRLRSFLASGDDDLKRFDAIYSD